MLDQGVEPVKSGANYVCAAKPTRYLCFFFSLSITTRNSSKATCAQFPKGLTPTTCGRSDIQFTVRDRMSPMIHQYSGITLLRAQCELYLSYISLKKGTHIFACWVSIGEVHACFKVPNKPWSFPFFSLLQQGIYNIILCWNTS